MAEPDRESKREKLADHFRADAPEIADMYVSAVDLLFSDYRPGRIRLACHAVRELMNRLLDAYVADLPDRTETKRRKDSIEGKMKHTLSKIDPMDQSTPSIDDTTLLSFAKDSISILQNESEQTHQKRVYMFFRILLDEDQTGTDYSTHQTNQWMAIHKWFRMRAHLPEENTDPEQYLDEAIDHFEALEICLFSLFGGFFETIEELDDILQEAN